MSYTVERQFYKTGRPTGRYLVTSEDGTEEVKLPSVTTILGATVPKPFLVPWAARVGVEWAVEQMQAGKEASWVLEHAPKRPAAVAQQAADIGSAVHAYAEAYLLGQEPPPHDLEGDDLVKVENGIRLFREWWDEAGFELLDGGSEKAVASLALGYAGTADCLVLDDEFHVTLVDFKTSKSIYDENLLQVIAYAHAFTEMTEQPVERLVIARFGKEDAEFEVQEIEPELWDALWDEWCRKVQSYGYQQMMRQRYFEKKKEEDTCKATG